MLKIDQKLFNAILDVFFATLSAAAATGSAVVKNEILALISL